MVVALIYGSDCPWPFLIEINDPSQVVPTDILLMKAVKSILVQLKLGEQRTVLGIRPEALTGKPPKGSRGGATCR